MAASVLSSIFSVSIQLDETNYSGWFFLMYHHLRAHGLLQFVDGSHSCPIQSCDAEAYEKWLMQDSSAICLIVNALSADALTLVIGCQTSMEVWTTLKQHYASNSEFHVMQLKSEMQNIRKGSETIDQYLLCFKSIRDKLAVVGITLDDLDVKALILVGLPIEYAHTRQLIRSKSSVTMEEVRILLLSAESDIKMMHKDLSSSVNGVCNDASEQQSNHVICNNDLLSCCSQLIQKLSANVQGKSEDMLRPIVAASSVASSKCGEIDYSADNIDFESVLDGDNWYEQASDENVHIMSLADHVVVPKSKSVSENLREDENIYAEKIVLETEIFDSFPDEFSLAANEPLVKYETGIENMNTLENLHDLPKRNSSVVQKNEEVAERCRGDDSIHYGYSASKNTREYVDPENNVGEFTRDNDIRRRAEDRKDRNFSRSQSVKDQFFNSRFSNKIARPRNAGNFSNRSNIVWLSNINGAGILGPPPKCQTSSPKAKAMSGIVCPTPSKGNANGLPALSATQAPTSSISSSAYLLLQQALKHIVSI